MAILNRLMSIIKAKTNSALDEIEDSREILELSLAETKEQLIKIKESSSSGLVIYKRNLDWLN